MIRDIFNRAGVIPVLEIERLQDAAPLATALIAGGLQVIELTLRTACAVEAITVIKESAPDLIVGMGTVVTGVDIDRSVEGGADFLVSPGSPTFLLHLLKASPIPALPGVGTVTEAMTAHNAGFDTLKFFPAASAGGHAFLKSVNAILPNLQFCPTGGISRDQVESYLSLSNVSCVGGTWIAPQALIRERNWSTITENACAARTLAHSLAEGTGERKV